MNARLDKAVSLIHRRNQARRERDWLVADALRLEVEGLGYKIEDGKHNAELIDVAECCPYCDKLLLNKLEWIQHLTEFHNANFINYKTVPWSSDFFGGIYG